jgi:hypothetical protein
MPPLGGRLLLLFGLLLSVSALTGWYTGEGVGTTVSVIGWHTGTIGKLVFLLGALAVLIAVLREVGISLPPSVPESLLAIGIGISLVCAIGIIVAGLFEASEEL